MFFAPKKSSLSKSNNPVPENMDLWVSSAQDGDKDAFGHIFDHFFDAIYRYVSFRSAEAEIEDIVGIVFIKAWTNLNSYKKSDVSFGAWLFRIAHNCVVDSHRKHRPISVIDSQIEDLSEGAAPQRKTEEVLLGESLRKEIATLNEPYRQVITLKFLSGLENDEIAEIMGEREGNVRLLQFRGLKKLRQRLESRGFVPEFLS